ncbi:MAG: YicC family protein [Flavobacteriales bacterium]|nr:YicC family protein [Flavobacteriales bacterium]
MIHSMTGYGKAEGEVGNRKFTVEIRSLNSKQFDLSIRMPSIYKEKEMSLRSYLTKNVVRGKSDLTIFYESGVEEKKVVLNKPLMISYHEDLKELSAEMGQENVDFIGSIMRIPEVLRPEKEELNEDEWSKIMELIKQAVAGLQEYRTQEGNVLFQDFTERVNNILTHRQNVQEPLEKRITRVKERIKNNLNEWVDSEKIDTNRFEQEIIYYLEKIDVTEELVRLKGNCEYFLEILNADKSQGKKLGFICQEIGREINTLGSKANDADVQRYVVQMKDELEKIKEQILNVL